MFFLLSKILLWLLQPLVIVMLGLAAAYGTARRGHALLVKRLIAGCLSLLFVAGVSPLSTALLLPLEERFPRAEIAPDVPVAGILVLGGAEEARIANARHVVSLNEAGERMTEAMSLARRFPKARLVFTGGSTEIITKPVYGADSAERFFRDQGLDMSRLTLERRSRNTYENGAFTLALVAPKPNERWILVTSAFHMPRSVGVFRKLGWNVAPWPVDYRTEGWSDALQVFSNPADGIKRLEIVLKEWVGLAAYRLTGRSSDLFPGPIQ